MAKLSKKKKQIAAQPKDQPPDPKIVEEVVAFVAEFRSVATSKAKADVWARCATLSNEHAKEMHKHVAHALLEALSNLPEVETLLLKKTMKEV